MDKIASGWGSDTYIPGLWVRYKLTQKDFEDMWAEQKGRCALCVIQLAHPKTKAMGLMGVKFYVDHRHELGEVKMQTQKKQVRGLLCRDCNELLKVTKESVTWMERAAAYLKKHGTSVGGIYSAAPTPIPEVGLSLAEQDALYGYAPGLGE